MGYTNKYGFCFTCNNPNRRGNLHCPGCGSSWTETAWQCGHPGCRVLIAMSMAFSGPGYVDQSGEAAALIDNTLYCHLHRGGKASSSSSLTSRPQTVPTRATPPAQKLAPQAAPAPRPAPKAPPVYPVPPTMSAPYSPPPVRKRQGVRAKVTTTGYLLRSMVAGLVILLTNAMMLWASYQLGFWLVNSGLYAETSFFFSYIPQPLFVYSFPAFALMLFFTHIALNLWEQWGESHYIGWSLVVSRWLQKMAYYARMAMAFLVILVVGIFMFWLSLNLRGVFTIAVMKNVRVQSISHWVLLILFVLMGLFYVLFIVPNIWTRVTRNLTPDWVYRGRELTQRSLRMIAVLILVAILIFVVFKIVNPG
jgi:hypothetical protein